MTLSKGLIKADILTAEQAIDTLKRCYEVIEKWEKQI